MSFSKPILARFLETNQITNRYKYPIDFRTYHYPKAIVKRVNFYYIFG